ncbi:NlpC/P60 family protein [Vibrio lamellibrachiae]|uniref:NlpC/P60 family protein n=1 Tax=Vibrio lamellibrachiae TaxID=2910253 RepID=UPI003D0C01D5
MKFQSVVLVTITFSLITGCATSSTPAKTASIHSSAASQSSNLSSYEKKTKNAFLSVYNRWEGVPYRLGGNSFQGIDCSAFVQVAYRDALNVTLPRTTLHQSKLGSSVNYNDASIGDLIFFKTSRTTRHVGVYLGERQFLHASTSKGVIISRVDNPYWASKFWHFRRVEHPPQFN